MEQRQQRLAELHRLWFNDQITDEELNEFLQLLDESSDETEWYPLIKDMFENAEDDGMLGKEKKLQLAEYILTNYPARTEQDNPDHNLPVHGVHFLRTAWFRYAAAVVILLGVGAYLYTTQKAKPAHYENLVKVSNVPAPESNRATLTLANGEQIFLDSIGTGLFAHQDGVAVQKNSVGEIKYLGKSTSGVMGYNTLTVPRGSKVASLILSDGSKVYLNAASSIRYPVSFKNSEREVEVTGEVYFEVAKNANWKFVVVSGNLRTQVLGTQFNVNAYPDESSIKVTLIEGSIRVSSKTRDVVIKPGQQAELITGNQLITNERVNLSQVLAWRKGVFILNDMDLHAILRQVGRWYDVEVQYRGDVQQGNFGGALSRRSSLLDVINALRAYGIKCTLEGTTLIVEK